MNHVAHVSHFTHTNASCHTNEYVLSQRVHESRSLYPARRVASQRTHRDETNFSNRIIAYTRAATRIIRAEFLIIPRTTRWEGSSHLSTFETWAKDMSLSQYAAVHEMYCQVNANQLSMRHVTFEGHATYVWVMSYMNASCHIWMSHVTYERTRWGILLRQCQRAWPDSQLALSVYLSCATLDPTTGTYILAKSAWSRRAGRAYASIRLATASAGDLRDENRMRHTLQTPTPLLQNLWVRAVYMDCQPR